jgi:alpha-beta hydrolase superfamily lysophospholipase
MVPAWPGTPRLKVVARSLLVASILAAGATGGLGWHVAGRIHDEALLPSYDLAARARFDDAAVTRVDSTSISLNLRANERGRATRDGTWGLLWAGGSGRLGAIRSRQGGVVSREFAPVAGLPEPGTLVDVRFEPYQGDPRSALDLDFRDVTIDGELGPLPAWEIPGSTDVWAICVHGKGAGRIQMLREADRYAARGFTVLVPSYRNDIGAPASPDGRYHYGLTEWRDLESAVDYARARGARSIVLHGMSMGGGIVFAFLVRSPRGAAVTALVLDSPMLDFGATIDWGISRARVPGLNVPIPLIAGPIGKTIAAWRDDVDWRALDLLRSAGDIDIPILVFQGDRDGVIPPATSRNLAARFPGLVTLVRVPGADHGESWNVDRTRYVRALDAFLERVVP